MTTLLLIYSFFKKTIKMLSKGFSLSEINKNYIILFNIVNKILDKIAFQIIGWKKSKDYFILSAYSTLISKMYSFLKLVHIILAIGMRNFASMLL